MIHRAEGLEPATSDDAGSARPDAAIE